MRARYCMTSYLFMGAYTWLRRVQQVAQQWGTSVPDRARWHWPKIFLNSTIFLLILAESNRKLEFQQGDKETRISTHSSLGRCHMWSTRFVFGPDPSKSNGSSVCVKIFLQGRSIYNTAPEVLQKEIFGTVGLCTTLSRDRPGNATWVCHVVGIELSTGQPPQ